jgi:hypothetical protein
VFAYIAYYKEAIATGETSNDSQQRKQFWNIERVVLMVVLGSLALSGGKLLGRTLLYTITWSQTNQITTHSRGSVLRAPHALMDK